MAAYRSPPNQANLLVSADCRPNNKAKKTSKPHHKRAFLHQGPSKTSLVPNHQLTTLSFLLPRASFSLTRIPIPHGETPVRSSSLTTRPTPKNNTCTNSKCTFCPILNKGKKLNCTLIEHSLPYKLNITCKSSNLIYLITSQTCRKQYVGQTKNSNTQRFYSHFFTIRVRK